MQLIHKIEFTQNKQINTFTDKRIRASIKRGGIFSQWNNFRAFRSPFKGFHTI